MIEMKLDVSQPLNTKVLHFLRLHRKENYYVFPKFEPPVFAAWDSIADPYYECGCHPDVVEFLWEQLARCMPVECRGLVYGIPCLVHPNSGIIFALGVGTIACLRLPASLYAEALKDGAKTYIRLQPSGSMNVTDELGKDWILSPSKIMEPVWYRAIFTGFDLVP